MTRQADFIRAIGTPPSFLEGAMSALNYNPPFSRGQTYYDHVMVNFHAAMQPDQPSTLPRATDPHCAYCEVICLGDVCRNCGARRVSP